MKSRISIKIPNNSSQFLLLVRNILKQHETLGQESPLKDLEMDALVQMYQLAKEKCDEQQALKIAAETATQERNKLLGWGKYKDLPDTLYRKVLQIRNTLEGTFYMSEHLMGAFGYLVNQSSSKSSKKEEGTNSASLSPPEQPADDGLEV